MSKWIVILVCASALTACGSMAPPSSSGGSDMDTSSGAGTAGHPMNDVFWNGHFILY